MGTLVYPKNLATGLESPAWIRFSYFDRLTPVSSEAVAEDKICIYMPEAASQPSTVSWGSEKFGFVGNAIASSAKAGMAGYDAGGWKSALAVGSATADEKTGGAGNIANLAAIRGLASVGSALAQTMGGNVSAEGLMGAVAGKIPNPYLTMIFEGVNFRNFAFTFKFYPFEESDCDTIYKIYQTMRRNSLPQLSEDTAKTFLGYPKECEIEYMWDLDVNPWLHKFKRSVCTAIDIDYTASGMFSVMRNGFPSEIVVSTKWSEIEIITRDDVNLEKGSF